MGLAELRFGDWPKVTQPSKEEGHWEMKNLISMAERLAKKGVWGCTSQKRTRSWGVRSKAPAVGLCGEGNLSAILELAGVFYTLCFGEERCKF